MVKILDGCWAIFKTAVQTRDRMLFVGEALDNWRSSSASNKLLLLAKKVSAEGVNMVDLKSLVLHLEGSPVKDDETGRVLALVAARVYDHLGFTKETVELDVLVGWQKFQTDVDGKAWHTILVQLEKLWTKVKAVGPAIEHEEEIVRAQAHLAEVNVLWGKAVEMLESPKS